VSGTRPRVAWRDLDGLLLLDKPLGLSSNQALQRARRLIGAAKAGHTGSLDPLATGMLPICIGQATKVCAYLLDSDKVYTATLRLGTRTATGDAEGEVVETRPVPAAADLAIAATALTGVIRQVPPMYSALKVGGERLYALARAGVEVEREAREVTVHSLAATRLADGDVFLNVHCSKGTYVRTLGEDFARALGTVGHLVALRREWVAPFQRAPMHSLEALETALAGGTAPEALLLPTEAALPDWPALELDAGAEADIRHGRSVPSGLPPCAEGRDVRLHAGGRLLALGHIAPLSSAVAPLRLLAAGAGTSGP
jgi:tRNA pseudouridine55 synthase